MSSNESDLDKSQVPLFALRPRTRDIISLQLNSKKLIQTPEGLQRDWRGIAHLIGYTCIPNDCPNPTELIFSHWEKQKPSPTLTQLQAFFGQIDRWDILDDTASLIDEDAQEYLKRKKNGYCDVQRLDLDLDKQVLTVDDIYRLEQGLEPQTYDAFLLFADEDSPFAERVVDKLENDQGLRLCLKDRDLVGGLWFEHEAIMKLISQRCNRLIIILSPSFLQSSMNKFFVTYAQALGIEQRQRKIIPCTYQKFELPTQLRHYFILDYTRSGHFFDFWNKLSQSVMSPTAHQQLPEASRCLVREIEDMKNNLHELKVTMDSPNATQEDHNGGVTHLTKERRGATQVVQAQRNHRKISSLFRKLLPSPPNSDPGRTSSKNFFSRKKKVALATHL